MARNLLYRPGDVIQDYEKPFLMCLDVAYKKLHCNCCLKRLEKPSKPNSFLIRCPICKSVYYCNSTCQKLDLQIAHSVECKLFANPPKSMVKFGGMNDDIVKISRLISFLKLHEEEATKQYQMFDGSSRCFNDLQNHCDAFKTNAPIKQMIKSLASILKDSKLFSPLECSPGNLLRVIGIWKINAFAMSNEEDTEIIGSALYITSSSFNHSCRPNALRVMDDSGRMQIRCISAIAHGDEPRITYLAGVRNRADRQLLLKKRYFFDCKCSLCENEREGGPVVNYDKLERVRAVFKRHKIYTDGQFARAKHILREMHKIFCQYDERITNMYDATLEKLVVALTRSSACVVKVSNVKEFAKTVEENLRISFGIDHKDYKYYAERIVPRLNALKN